MGITPNPGRSPQEPVHVVARGVIAREEARITREESRRVVAASGDVTGRLEHEVETLKEALSTRTIIANAVGMLMVSGNVTRDEAFDQLRRASQRTNRKLRDLAAEMVERHESRLQERAPSQAIVG